MENLEQVKTSFIDRILSSSNVEMLEQIRVEALGKQGTVSLLMKELGSCAPEDRKEKGQALNQLREALIGAFTTRRHQLEQLELEAKLATQTLDVTLPVRPIQHGYIHPLSQTWFEVVEIFRKMGFAVAQGPHIETDFNNFTGLNFSADHPARQDHDTFYLNGVDQDGKRLVLRTHTSPVQIRTMIKQKPPIKIVIPGRTFRSDSDATHTPNFHQIEGLYIDKEIHMGHLKSYLLEFFRQFFQVSKLKLRFRSSYFPFTEPSAEVDISCTRSKDQLVIEDGKDWLEILGCGMVHPNVLKNCGLNPDEWQGFAWGMGLERLAMLKYGIPDLRSFYESDMRWIKHYGFSHVRALAPGDES